MKVASISYICTYFVLLVTKPGMCPVVDKNAVGTCVEECNSDDDCSGQVNTKCCSNGCGHVCTRPAAGTSFTLHPYTPF